MVVVTPVTPVKLLTPIDHTPAAVGPADTMYAAYGVWVLGSVGY